MVTTFGVEEELMVVDTATGELSPRSVELINASRPELGGAVVGELNRSQIETNTEPCRTLDELAAQLRGFRDALRKAGDRLGLTAVALASHPWSAWHDQPVNTDVAHYRRLLADYQQVARETVICGCHIHVGIEDPDDRIRTMNGVTSWLPALLALSANSPWWLGHDTGYASYRAMVWTSWPTATMPPFLADYAAYLRLVASLRAVEAIDDASALYWYVRPSAKLPTLEFRVTDTCLRVEDAVTVAGLARALAVTAKHSSIKPSVPPPTALLDTALWRAARYGLEATLVDPVSATLRPAKEVIQILLEEIGPALEEAGDSDRVHDGVSRILTEGNGASLQRALLQAGTTSPPDALAAIVGLPP